MILLDDTSTINVTPSDVDRILVTVIRQQIADTVPAAVERAIRLARGRVD
jgi:hypothetical protein